MSTEKNKDVVRRLNLEVIPGHQLEALGEVLDPGYENHGGTKAPWATIVQGLDKVKAAFGGFDPTFRVTIEDIIAEGDKVAIRLIWYQDGKPIANAMTFYRLSGGKIVDDWYCYTYLDKE